MLVISKNPLDADKLRKTHSKGNQVFITVDCDKTDYDDLVLEIFGYEKEFDGNDMTVLGLVEVARDGIIFFRNLPHDSPLYEDLMNVYERKQFCRAGNLQPKELKAGFIISLKY